MTLSTKQPTWPGWKKILNTYAQGNKPPKVCPELVRQPGELAVAISRGMAGIGDGALVVRARSV